MTSSERAVRVRAQSATGRADIADFGRRLWHKGADDDVLFLASGVAFNILLAGVPFFLLLASGFGYALGATSDAANAAVTDFIRDLFPTGAGGTESVLDPAIHDIIRTRGAAGVLGAVAFVWFSTRLFGSLRAVFNRTFDVPRGRGIILGKLYDVGLTISATFLVVVWIAVSAYFAIARTRGVAFLADLGLHADVVMRPLMYVLGRLISVCLLTTIFFAIYKLLPFRVVRWQQALIGAISGAALFEIARMLFGWIVHHWNPATLYTGTLAAVVVVVFWVYYAALIVIIGAEISQVHESAHTAKLKAR